MHTNFLRNDDPLHVLHLLACICVSSGVASIATNTIRGFDNGFNDLTVFGAILSIVNGSSIIALGFRYAFVYSIPSDRNRFLNDLLIRPKKLG